MKPNKIFTDKKQTLFGGAVNRTAKTSTYTLIFERHEAYKDVRSCLVHAQDGLAIFS